MRRSLILCSFLALASVLSAQTTWTGSASSNWAAAGNWSAGVPNSGVDAVIPSGTPNSPSTSGVASAACQGLTLAAGASLTIASGFPLAASGSVAIDGSIAGGSPLRLVGSQGAAMSGAGTCGSGVEVSKSATGQVIAATSMTINGSLTQTSGIFTVSQNPNTTISVSGNATFQGGTLQIFNLGTFDVAGNVTFSGTVCSSQTPTIRCAGNWTADANYAPNGGDVVLDGSGAQTISGTNAFPNLTIEQGSSTTAAASGLTVNQTLTVNGSLNASVGPFDANGAVVVNATGSLNVGGGSDTIGGSLSVTGTFTATGTIVFDSANGTSVSCSSALPNVLVSKSGPGQVIAGANMTVNGNLTQTSGIFTVSQNPNTTISVSGNATFQGGTLQIFNLGTFDVAGNVTFSGTACSSQTPTIRCAGNWTADANYAPNGGDVVFDGSGAQTISGTNSFPNLTIEQGSSTTAAASGLTVNQTLTVNGSLNASVGPFDANGTVVVNATGSLNVGGGSDTIGGSLSVTGTFTATGTIVFDSGNGTSVSCSSALPNVLVSKSGTAQVVLAANMTINGNLTQTSGIFTVSQNPNTTISVSGNATFQGGTLQIFNLGTFDVAGNVTFSGTVCSSQTPTIRCGANWNADANYAPTGGDVVFDGSGAQAISGTTTFPNLTIEQASITTASASGLTINQALIVNGSLNASVGPFDANGDVTVNTGGSLDVGGGADTIAGSLTVGGALTATGTIVFDGAGTTAISATAPLPNLQVSKSGTAQVFPVTNVTVSGNFTQTSGTLTLALNPGLTVSVSGNASFQGGILQIFNLGTLDVAGDVTFSGTVCSGQTPTIRCAGNWTADASFAPTFGTVELDGANPTSIASGTPGGMVVFADLVIKNAVRSPSNDFTLAAINVAVDANAALAVGTGRHLRVHRSGGPTSLSVNGGLSVAPNGELSLGPQTTAIVNGGALLTLVGTVAQTAKITGEAGGGYSLIVNGGLAANHFVVKEMGAGGMLVDFPATLAPAPNDFRNGTFDFRSGATAGSVLLDLRRQAPGPDFDGMTFLNTPGAAGVFNARTSSSGVPISFTNWTGAFAGPAFENDPNNLVAWNLQPAPTMTFFIVRPGAELAEIVWQTATQANVVGFELRRAFSAAGPFTTFLTTPNTGSSYGFIDAPRTANQPVFYALYAQMSLGDLLLVGAGSATPYSSAPPGNVKKVGGDGPFATIQDAINAATDPNSVVWVTPGTYAAFTIGATAVPSNLHVLGDGTGQVNIDTSSGPIQILNVPVSSGVELSNLIVGSPSASQGGIVVTNCACPVVLDSLDVLCDGAHTAITVSGSPGTAIQRSNIAGGTGLSVANGSYVAISRGSLSSLVSTASTVEMATLTPGSVNVVPAGSLITRTGLMADINVPEFVRLSFPQALFIDAQPNAPFIILAAPRLGFATGPFEMPALLDPFAMTSLPTMFTDGLGQAGVGFVVTPDASLLGFTFVVQAVVGDPVSGAARLSNVESMVCLP